MNIEKNRRGKFNVFVKRISEGSCEIQVNCMFQQTIQDALTEISTTRKCVSTGNLEAQMFNIIKMKIGK